ncbi:MAG: hypothetical protein JNJ83_24675 [Verrucomicrobiaceae bacterium]|nr:hypothetical protein [Verrucomicrobiaceae bacterium]
MLKHPLFATVLAASAFVVPAVRAAVEFDVETGGAWVGKADVTIPSEGGTPFSMVDDLGGDEVQAYYRLRANWLINDRHEVSALFAPLSFDFSGEFSDPVHFVGRDFAAGRPTTGKYTFNSYRLTYRYNFWRSENLTFGLGLTAKVRDAEIELSQGGLTRSDSNVGVVPLINFKLDWRFAPRWHLLFEGDALAASQGRAEDVMLAISHQATDNLAVRVGYRILEGGADNGDIDTFALFHYAMVGLTWRF